MNKISLVKKKKATITGGFTALALLKQLDMVA
jgi:hypothetical protein